MALPSVLPMFAISLSRIRGSKRLFSNGAAVLVLLSAAGCGDKQFSVSTNQAGAEFTGNVSGGHQPIAGSVLQLYATGNTGNSSVSTPLLEAPATANSAGEFRLGSYICPSPSTNVYITAVGGKTSLNSGTANPNFSAMAALGACGDLTSATHVSVNEVSTVAAVYALAPYMKSYSSIGSDPIQAQLMTDAFRTATEMVNNETGSIPGTGLPAGQTVPSEKMSSLANIVSTCIKSAGGKAGDGSGCGSLFSLATQAEVAPTETIGALLNIASNPYSEVLPLYLLSPGTGPFQPSMTSAPSDWTLALTSRTPPPVLLPAPGVYPPAQPITLSASNTSTKIYYTTDGSTPTSSSRLYSGALSLSATAMVRAISIAAGVSSVPVAGIYIIQHPVVTLSPNSVTLEFSQTQMFGADVAGTANRAVTWSIRPSVGTVSSGGLYTAPASIATAETVSITATSAVDPTVSASSIITLTPPVSTGSSYYMSPTGSDSSGNGTQANPWLTPNHAGLNCGDTITAGAGVYPAFTIETTPQCSTHNAVFVQCTTFAACKVNGSQSQGGILVQASFWAVLGWEVTTPHGSSDYASCFQATPGHSGPIHDIYFINDVANGCQAGGFTSSNAVDYFAAVADIAYNASQGNSYCYSGFSVWQPLASDTAPGTHIYLSQLFSWNNVDPSYCQGGNSTDGEGVILDTFNGKQGGITPYAQQAVVENVLAMFNGAGGILEGGSGNSAATIYIRHNTAYANFINTNQNTAICGQILSVGWPPTNRLNLNVNTTLTGNLGVVPNNRLSGCGNNPAYAYFFGNVDATTHLDGNASYSPASTNVGTYGLTTGFSPGTTNLSGTNPVFANPVQPPAPSCSTSANVIACMATVIANFTPTNPVLSTYGYQKPSPALVYDPLFPQWLCNSKIPRGLTTMGCTVLH